MAVTKDALFSRVDNECGCIPPREGRRIYYGRVDPYLIFGCEITLDLTDRTGAELNAVSNAFLRHILGVHENLTVAFLYSEMGTICIEHDVDSCAYCLFSLIAQELHPFLTGGSCSPCHISSTFFSCQSGIMPTSLYKRPFPWQGTDARVGFRTCCTLYNVWRHMSPFLPQLISLLML